MISYLEQINNKELVKKYLNRVCQGWNKIDSLLIEATNACNLNCVMCKRTIEKKENGFMDIITWKEIIDDLPNLNVKAITPFWYGEPFLHPNIIEMLEYAFDKNYNIDYDKQLKIIKDAKDENLLKDFTLKNNYNNHCFEYMEIHTNGNLLDKEKIDFLFSEKSVRSLKYLVFSIDANCKKTYDKIRQGGDFDKVINNIKYCLELKKNKKGPILVLQFIVMKENYEEAEQFVDFWKKEFDDNGIPCQINGGYEPAFEKDTIFLRVLGDLEMEKQPEAWKLHDQVISKSKHFTKNKKYEEVNDKEYVRNPCAGPFKTPVINWNGEVGICCYDYNMSMKLGNVKDLKLSYLWNLDKVMKKRFDHINGDFNGVCENCINLNSPQITDEEIVEYLMNVNKDKIISYLQRTKNFKLMKRFI